MPSIEFLYDYASPNCYVALHKLEQMEKQGLVSRLTFTPIFLGGLFKSTNDDPLPKSSLEYKYMETNLKRLSKNLGISFQFTDTRFPVNSLKTLRGSYYARQKGKEREYMRLVFDSCWAKDLDITSSDVIKNITSSLDLDYDDFTFFIESQEAKQKLRSDTDSAHERGVFGAPTYFIEKEMYWGSPEILWFLEGQFK
ncbi:MAG: DsbA family protein [Nitrososphaerales archaeon]